MSQSGEIASDVELDGQEPGSVYDFLYHDVRRVGSFLAQIDPFGHLTSLKGTETAESGSSMKSRAEAGGSVVVARGNAAFEDQRTAGEKETLERAYDPLWTNAIELLGLLQSRGLIKRELHHAGIGGLVLISGTVSVVDASMLRDAWGSQAIRNVMQRNIDSFVNAAPPQQKKNYKDMFNLFFDIVKVMPHGTQAHIVSDQGMLWCNLRDDRGGRLRLDSVSLSMSGASAGCSRGMPSSGCHAERA